MDYLFACLAAYLIGSIPFGLLLAKAAGQGDIRQIGSGNIGATNVLRTGKKGLAALVLLLDLAKGLGAVMLAWHLWPVAAGVAALAAVIGHCFPIWLGFRGGKGVATMAGACFGLFWPIGAVFAAAWIGVLLVTRISSLGGLAAAVSAPVTAALLGEPEFVPWLAGLALLVVVQHRENIARLLKGEEPRVGGKK